MLAGVGLANMYVNISVVAVIVGLNSALATLISQSHGQGNMKLCGIYLNRARIVIFLIQIPLTGLLLGSKQIFMAIGIQEEQAMYA